MAPKPWRTLLRWARPVTLHMDYVLNERTGNKEKVQACGCRDGICGNGLLVSGPNGIEAFSRPGLRCWDDIRFCYSGIRPAFGMPAATLDRHDRQEPLWKP